jgi:hypothetical protein
MCFKVAARCSDVGKWKETKEVEAEVSTEVMKSSKRDEVQRARTLVFRSASGQAADASFSLQGEIIVCVHSPRFCDFTVAE